MSILLTLACAIIKHLSSILILKVYILFIIVKAIEVVIATVKTVDYIKTTVKEYKNLSILTPFQILSPV